MKKCNILITGGSGFIGTHLCKKLDKLDANVMVLSRKPLNQNKYNSIKWCVANLHDPLTYIDKIHDFKPNIVIHLSWSGIPDFNLENSQENLINSINFFNFLFSLKSVKKIIVSGSCWEYNKDKGECSEIINTTSKNFFTWAKHSLRIWLQTECLKHECNLTWLRIFYVYGPMQRDESLIPSLIKNLKTYKKITLKKPYNSVDFIYIDDLINAILCSVFLKNQSGVYNIGSGYTSKIINVCKTIEQVIYGKEKITNDWFKHNKNFDNDEELNFWANIEKATVELNWYPNIDLKSGILKTIKYND